MRDFIKHTICSLAFIAGLLALLLLISQIVMPKSNIKSDGIQDPMANGILSEPENTIDVLILGDSETYTSMIPLQMWRDYGLTTYCCGTSRQDLCYSMEFLQKAFRGQTPKIVILETDAVFRAFSIAEAIAHKADSLLPVFTYHNRWKSLQAKDWDFAVNYTYIENTKGYSYSTAIAEASDKDYMRPSSDYEPIPSKNRRYVENILSFCEENGAKLIMLSTPSTTNWNNKRHNSIQKLAEDLGIEYIDTNLMREQIPIDWKKDTRDKGDHLNHSGAIKVTEYLGKHLSESGLLTDHRADEQYKHWYAALDEFNNATSNSLKK